MGLAMLWEHPRLAESLVQSFRSSQQIPDRSLSDGLLQQINRTAYERDFSVNSEEDIKPIKQKMETAIENLKVPFSVDVALGKSWGEAKE